MADVQGMSLADRQAAVDLVYRIFWLIDHGRAAETAALFLPDGTLTFGPGAPKPGTIAGHAIAAAMAARQAQANVTTRHVLGNPSVTANADGSLSVSTLLTLFRSEDSGRDSYPASVADIDDVVVRSDAGWRIKARLITPIFNRS